MALVLAAAYSCQNQIKFLNSNNFNTNVTSSNKFCIILFYSSQSPKFKLKLKVAKALEAVKAVRIGCLDGATEKSFVKQIGVKSYNF